MSVKTERVAIVTSFVPITNKDRSVMQGGRTGFQPLIPVGQASSPSIKWDRQSRVLRGTSPPNRFFSQLFLRTLIRPQYE